ncbi:MULTISPECIES: hemerythrin domain-containing protein [Mycobacterium]|uniref:Hemerythrin-like domain-containing protein n=1 Tax=Mycobacterium kiyosense TaxID=2871094 RepID=A0A9P3Q5C2_9MYCO|nr:MULTISPECIES: hemerythrin domain-containing protein [Mycobacterium]BDB43265.1 hypothetical protein IWGMT90018_37110 [Mycobacterium kiyosense]BDE13537.1 hypothetical protein MKCMC460_23970 [Mycobacterium sp. 20KCMC460]GLB85410.1 hypothetical protein SRL2020028_46660 [Mycobacterium kiyosense]GLB88470.1 hypothetical protein SRL2020130_12870 [Mycobacterium kiyosense]GLB98868.1 hypothetical protein SRL2020226_56440 [Mycobacterium kiyosense]
MNAYDVLREHHAMLKALGRKVSAAPLTSPERHELFDEILLELDIHFRIEDELYYPALSAAGEWIAIAHKHRQVVDQLGRLMRTPQSAPGHLEAWAAFVTVLEAHADGEERDMIPAPPPVRISDADLEALGDKMAAHMTALRGSALYELRTRGKIELLRAM